MNIQIDSGFTEFGGVLMLFMLLLTYVMLIAVSVGQYVLQSLGTYTMAKRRGIRHPWLSWIPIGSDWMWGCLADQYQYVAKGKIKNRRKVLLALSILIVVLALVIFGLYVSIVVKIASNGETIQVMSNQQIVQLFMGEFLGAFAVAGMLYVVSIVLMVFRYIALHNIYVSCVPGNAVLYLVLSIVFSFLTPVFVFLCRKKDEGMPPRKEPEAEPVRQTIQEPWEQA